MEFPRQYHVFPPGALSVASVRVSPVGDINLGIRNAASSAAAWPAANRALYIPMLVEIPCTAYKIGWQNGATIIGNVSVGIYANDGRKQLVEGRAAHSGVNLFQAIDITDTYLRPGLYYLGMSSDSGSGTYFRATPNAILLQASGMQQQANAYPLPDPAAFNTVASSYVPMVTVAIAGAIL